MRGIFVSGTDTGVGKTEVACVVARIWRSRGLTVGAAKPVETGVMASGPADAQRLARAAEDTRPIAEICPMQFSEPLAPAVAAERAGTPLEPERLLAAVVAAGRGRDRVVAECAGG
ncbi:MAG TPA: dethiobiotin synthase, partial [bacterium]|nr:dethiobiotin synthase [bacterium]